jgi:hypothetical protein
LFGFRSRQHGFLFPNGVPGVTQGIPPEYREGYKPPAIADLPPGDTDATASAGQPAATAKSAPVEAVRESSLGKPEAAHRRTVSRKPKPHRRVVKRKPEHKPHETATVKPSGTTAPWPSTPPQEAAAPQTGTAAPWPSATPQQQPQTQTQAGWPGGQQQPDQKLAPWPSAPPSGSFSK